MPWYYTTSIKNGIRYCPLFCTSCYIVIEISSTSTSGVCDTCIEDGELDGSGGCVCKKGYYADGVVEKCNKCPEMCMSCSSVSGNTLWELELGNCRCKLGFYYDQASTSSCSKCPDTCISCSLANGNVVCDKCILNSHILLNICVYNSGYVYSLSNPDFCYKNLSSVLILVL